MYKKMFIGLFVLGLPLLATPLHVFAQEEEEGDDVSASAVTKGNFPRYASIKKGEVNVRSGPGTQYPILWIYQRPGYPVQLLTRYDNYYKIRDAEGEEGWAYLTMISAQRTALVGSMVPTPLRRNADAHALVLARLAPGLTVQLKDDICQGLWCKVEAGGYKGWVAKKDLLMVE